MSEYIKGSCLCGQVAYQVKNDFKQFHQCHCQQCRKITGSAHASNIFTEVDNLTWLTGEALLKTYNYPDRTFRKVFCSECGSGMPYESRRAPIIVIPAGSLDEEPNMEPMDHIFWQEHAQWYEKGRDKPIFEKFPGK